MEPEDIAALLELGRNPGEEGHPDDLFDRISTSYDHATSTRDAAYGVQGEEVTRLTEELAAAAEMLRNVQAHNYTLMMALEGDAVSNDSGDDSGDADDSPFSGDAPVDSLWEVVED